MEDISIFRNYKEGEPSRRLYIKNLAKNVTEEVCSESAFHFHYDSGVVQPLQGVAIHPLIASTLVHQKYCEFYN